MQGFRINMEDQMSIKLGLSETHPNHCFAGVFDGHAGTKASEYLRDNLVNKISELKNPEDPQQIKDAVMAVDADFLRDSTLENKEHGSTCIFAVFWPNHDISETDESKKSWSVLVSNVGDSRAMILRKDGTCVSLSRDHKPEDPVEEARIIRAGGTQSQNRVDGQLAMSRAMGDFQVPLSPPHSCDLCDARRVWRVFSTRPTPIWPCWTKR
jgi:serine/threonine protein phosphatase PrpC